MGQRQRHGDRHLQGADRHVQRAVDAADQFLVVADDDGRRQHALLIHGKLLLQIHDALAQREQDFVLHETAARVVGADFPVQLVLDLAVHQPRQLDLALQLFGQGAHRLLVFAQRDVVAVELILADLQRAGNRVDHRLRAFELGEIALQRRADAGQLAEQPREPAGREVELAGIQLLDLQLQIDQGVGHRAAILCMLRQFLDRRAQHRTFMGGCLLQRPAHRFHRVLGLALGVQVARAEVEQRGDQFAGLGVEFRIDIAALANRLGVAQGQGALDLGDIEVKVQGRSRRRLYGAASAVGH